MVLASSLSYLCLVTPLFSYATSCINPLVKRQPRKSSHLWISNVSYDFILLLKFIFHFRAKHFEQLKLFALKKI